MPSARCAKAVLFAPPAGFCVCWRLQRAHRPGWVHRRCQPACRTVATLFPAALPAYLGSGKVCLAPEPALADTRSTAGFLSSCCHAAGCAAGVKVAKEVATAIRGESCCWPVDPCTHVSMLPGCSFWPTGKGLSRSRQSLPRCRRGVPLPLFLQVPSSWPSSAWCPCGGATGEPPRTS